MPHLVHRLLPALAATAVALASSAGCGPASTTTPTRSGAGAGSGLAPTPPDPARALPAILAASTLDGGPARAAAGPRGTVVILFASWCSHCRHELALLATLLPRHPGVGVIGLNYRPHEEYDQRGNAEAVRDFVAANAPWLVVVPADDTLFTAIGRPPKVPTMFVYDGAGQLVTTFDRRQRPPASEAELEAALAAIAP